LTFEDSDIFCVHIQVMDCFFLHMCVYYIHTYVYI